MEIDYTNLEAVLTWLTGIGAPFLVGYLLSLLAENWLGWHGLPSAVKFFVPMVCSVGISLGANQLLQLPNLLAMISPWWTLIAGSIIAYLGTQTGYMTAKRSEYGANPRYKDSG